MFPYDNHGTIGRPAPVGSEPGPSAVSPVLPVLHPKGQQACAPQRNDFLPAPVQPVIGYMSSRSDCSTHRFIDFNGQQPRLGQSTSGRPSPVGSEPGSGCMSVASERSTDRFIDFKDEQGVNQDPEGSCNQSVLEYHKQLNAVFGELRLKIIPFVMEELEKFQRTLNDPEIFQLQRDDVEERGQRSREALRGITVNFLRGMNQDELADLLESGNLTSVCQHKLKTNLKQKFRCLFEGIPQAGDSSLLNQIYTELYIAEGGTGEVNDEHEVIQIESAYWKPNGPEIKLQDLFKPVYGRDEPIRTLMTKGVAGIGKTVLTQKFSLDWAENKTNKDFQFMFPFTFRELNVLKENKFSLVELVHHFFNETKKAGIWRFEDFRVLFIFDGLDECRIPLDFRNTKILTDVTKSTSVDVLLINLIRGNLLPSAHLWITTRPAAASQIPAGCVDMVTEVRGFTDPLKNEYFRRRFRDVEKAKRIISHVEESRSLQIMCHIPIFCWITAKVLDDVLKTSQGEKLPKTLTEMYIQFLVVQTKLKTMKYDEPATDPHGYLDTRMMIERLGKLAFEQLKKGNLIFYESDLTECGIDIVAASVYSGVFTQIFREERGLYHDTAFCFVHLTVQEFLAALHVHLKFINSGVNLLSQESTRNVKSSVMHFYQNAVDMALESPNGHLDLFLRFLLGLSLENNQKFLQGLLTQTGRGSEGHQETVQYIKKKIEESPSGERTINLFHCLNELNDGSLVEEIQLFLNSGSISQRSLSPAQWSALGFILLSSKEDLDVFELKKYSASEEALLRLLPVIKASQKALLSGCNLSERSCEALSSALCSKSCSLRDLDLSTNNLQDSGVKLLSAGLGNPLCRLETLRLSCCSLTDRSCVVLSPILSSRSCSLRELDLSNNNLRDLGVKLLSVGLKSPNLRLDTLRLSGCLITTEGCSSLASALCSTYLRELDLSYNNPDVLGGKLLAPLIEDPRSTLKVLPAGVQWLKLGLRKYSCELTIDTNTVNPQIELSDDNRRGTRVEQQKINLPHLDRFETTQMLCGEGLTSRCYWEVDWRGTVCISVSYLGISRKGEDERSKFGKNKESWSLYCTDGEEVGYAAWHNNRVTPITRPSFSSMMRSLGSFSSTVRHRAAVYLDHNAGTLSFYRVSSGSLIHLHTFSTTFTGPLYPGFGFMHHPGSSVYLCPAP